ncbi:unnamed protein product [Dovyalis caffra]|uniref:Helicase C-terminal domain-containing protein n=1 Tax=Dovyalis caffra TaxID=77055 RepID=A0AAV1RWH5_9ROSI|nr:unnamed protein product [Dovyalis caffra]
MEGATATAISSSVQSCGNAINEMDPSPEPLAKLVYAKGGENIIFSQTEGDGDEVSTALTHSIASETLYGGISQHQRESTLNHFGRGKLTKHVATDVAFRGLDIQNVDLVKKLTSLPESLHSEFPPPKLIPPSKLQSLSLRGLQQINAGRMQWDLQ